MPTPPEYLPGDWADDDELGGCERIIEVSDEANQTSDGEEDE
jgi:hypothetical protein